MKTDSLNTIRTDKSKQKVVILCNWFAEESRQAVQIERLNCILLVFCGLFVRTCLTGDGLWLREASERSNVDALRHTRVLGSRNYSEQSMNIWWSILFDRHFMKINIVKCCIFSNELVLISQFLVNPIPTPSHSLLLSHLMFHLPSLQPSTLSPSITASDLKLLLFQKSFPP